MSSTVGSYGEVWGGGDAKRRRRYESESRADIISEWDGRKETVRFTDKDASLLHALRPLAEESADELVELFYDHITTCSSTRRFLTDPNLVPRLKLLQRGYLLELFSGEYGKQYVERRSQIGRAHERMGLAPHWYICVYGLYFETLIPFISQKMGTDAGPSISALTKIALLDISIATSVYFESYTREIQSFNRRLLKRLDRDENLLETISDTSIDAILSLNVSGHIQYWNGAAQRILGLAGDELEGRSFVELLRPRCQQVLPERLRPVETIELNYEHPQAGMKTFLMSVASLRDDRHEDVRTTIILRDITEKRRLQERVTVMEKISAMARVSGAIAHEIRTPLGALLLQADLLGEHLEQTEQDDAWRITARELTHDLAVEVDRLNNIVSDYLSMLRVSRMTPEDTDVFEYLSRVEKELRRRLDNWHAKMEFRVEDNLPRVRLDQNQFRRVFLNLFTNALEATHGQGNLIFGARLRDDNVQFYFEDDGPGIPSQQREQVLEPFYTTKSEGTGLGLYLVQEIVNAHGGKLLLEDTEPTGTRVIVNMPVCDTVQTAKS